MDNFIKRNGKFAISKCLQSTPLPQLKLLARLMGVSDQGTKDDICLGIYDEYVRRGGLDAHAPPPKFKQEKTNHKPEKKPKAEKAKPKKPEPEKAKGHPELDEFTYKKTGKFSIPKCMGAANGYIDNLLRKVGRYDSLTGLENKKDKCEILKQVNEEWEAHGGPPPPKHDPPKPDPKPAPQSKYKLYDILGVPRSATLPEIRKAYLKLVLKEHPDKGGDPEKFKKIQAAWNILSSDRSNYNAMTNTYYKFPYKFTA